MLVKFFWEGIFFIDAVCLVLNPWFQLGSHVAPHSGYISITDVVVLNCTVTQVIIYTHCYILIVIRLFVVVMVMSTVPRYLRSIYYIC